MNQSIKFAGITGLIFVCNTDIKHAVITQFKKDKLSDSQIFGERNDLTNVMEIRDTTS